MEGNTKMMESNSLILSNAAFTESDSKFELKEEIEKQIQKK